jgi:chromatin modification-related protein VID21
MEDIADVPMQIEKPPVEPASTRPSSALLNLDYGSDDEDDEDQEKEVDDGLDTSLMVEESLADLDQDNFEQGIGFKDLQPKTEEIDDTAVLRNEAMHVDKSALPEGETSDGANPEQARGGLKSTSDDPMLVSMSSSTSASSGTSKKKIHLYAPIRENIAHSGVEKLFLDFDDFLSQTSIRRMIP